MQKRGFYVDKTGFKWHDAYRKRTLRNLYIKWNLAKTGIPEELPDGFWIVTLKWHRSIIPGLHFGEV